MSIGIAIAEKETFKKADDIYFVFDPEYKVGGMYENVLVVKGQKTKGILCSRIDAMKKIMAILAKYEVNQLFAYNASFDKNLLKELSLYKWYDIMRIAAYRQHNSKIPANVECCNTGKMKRNYGVEPMMQLLSGNRGYRELHNALYDALDELEIMRLLGKPIDEYLDARI